MSYGLAVNSNNDIYVDQNGNLATVNGLSSVGQAIEHAVKTQLGEMVLTTNEGMPNFPTIWDGAPNIPQFEAALRATILSVTGVLEVLRITTILQKDILIYTALISTVYGPYDLAQEVPSV